MLAGSNARWSALQLLAWSAQRSTALSGGESRKDPSPPWSVAQVGTYSATSALKSRLHWSLAWCSKPQTRVRVCVSTTTSSHKNFTGLPIKFRIGWLMAYKESILLIGSLLKILKIQDFIILVSVCAHSSMEFVISCQAHDNWILLVLVNELLAFW